MFETKCNNVHCVSKNGTDVAQCNSTWSTNFNYFWQRCCWERHDWKDTISRVNVNVSPGRAETLVMRGGITSHNLIAYSLSNISAKYYQNRFMCIEVNSVQHQCRFFETQCRIKWKWIAQLWLLVLQTCHCRRPSGVRCLEPFPWWPVPQRLVKSLPLCRWLQRLQTTDHQVYLLIDPWLLA